MELKTNKALYSIDVSDATTKELVEFYNAHVTRQIKKFADRKTAERRVLDLIENHLELADEAPSESSESRSAAIAATWKDPAIAQKRAQRTAIEVKRGNSVVGEFGSMRKAFNALELPAAECIPFRMRVKKEGSVKEYGYRFTAVPLNY